MRLFEERTLSYAGIALGLSGPPHAVSAIRAEVEPFFQIDAAQAAPPLARVTLVDGDAPQLRDRCSGPGERVEVDTSLYAHLASSGTRWGGPDDYVVRIDATQTLVHFDRATASIELVQPQPELLIRDGARLIKSLLTPALEVRGSVQVHSSAVVTDDGAVLLLGEMWQGKTTLLLELLSEFNARQLSCDTVVIAEEPNGRLSAHGWPSPFSVSHGAMADYAALHSFFPNDRRPASYDTLWREGKKSVLHSADVARAFGTTIEPCSTNIRACVVIKFAPAEETRLRPITTERELIEYLPKVYLGSRDPIYHNWHGYWVCDNETIDRNIERIGSALVAQIPVYELTWSPSAVSLFKRIPVLGRAHKTLSRVLHGSAPSVNTIGEPG